MSMRLHLISFGPATYRFSQSAGSVGDGCLWLPLSSEDGSPIQFVDGIGLSDHGGRLQIACLREGACGVDESGGNVIYWNDPGKDGPAGAVMHYLLQLGVEPALYVALATSIGSRTVLEVEVEVPDVADGPVAFEALYALGMSRVGEFSIVLRGMGGEDGERDRAAVRGLMELRGGDDGRSGPGIAVW